MTIKTPLACIILVIFIAIYYKKNKHLKTTPSKQFMLIIFSSLTYLTLTMISMTIIKKAPSPLNTIIHTALALSLLLVYFLVYKYTVKYVEINKKQKFTKKILLVDSIVLVCSALIIALPSVFLIGTSGIFHYGPKIYALYVGFIFITTMEYEFLIVNKNDINKRQYNALITAVIMMTIMGLTQIVFPYINTCLLVALLVLSIYLSIENPDKYIDEKAECFNRAAFEKILLEKIFLNKDDTILLYSIKNYENISDVGAIVKEISAYSKTSCYRLSENVIAVFDEKNIGMMMDKEYYDIGFLPISDKDNIFQQVHNFIEAHSDNDKYLDKMTQVFNRNKFEKDVNTFLNYEKDLWYIIVDINNLKKTNDTMGHKYGDILITSVTDVLKDVFKDNCYIYRIGGDEFVIMSFNKEIDDLLKELDDKKTAHNETNEVKISFAIGHNKYIHGISSWDKITQQADMMMYENKREQKKNM